MPRRLIELRVYPDTWVLTPSFPERIVQLSYPFNDGMQSVLVAQSRAFYPVALSNIRAFNLKPETDVFKLSLNLFPEEALAFKAIPLDFQRRSGYCRVAVDVAEEPTPEPDTIAALQQANVVQDAAIADIQSALGTLATVPEWTNATLLNGWANFGAPFHPVSYCIDPKGVVRLRGVAYGTASTGTVMFTLPEGLRPLDRLILGIATGGVSYALQFGRIDFLTDGTVEFLSGGLYFVSFDGLSFVSG